MNVRPRACDNCRYWSDQVAAVTEGGIVVAACLNHDADKYSQYVAGVYSCPQHADGYLGAIDEPGADPLRYPQGE